MVLFEGNNISIQVILKVLGAAITFMTFIFYQVRSNKSYRKSPMVIINIGFVFVILGDYFLAYANKGGETRELFFPFGMGAYLIGYLLFGISFYMLSEFKFKMKNILVIILITTVTYLYYNILEIPTSLKIPLLAYSFMMIVLLTSSVFIQWLKKTEILFFSFAGAIYYTSDVIIGFKEFGGSGNPILMEFLIISTYAIGHIFMILGIKKYTTS